MNWLNTLVDELIARHPEGEILIESGGSPSGTHHLGHMREFLTSDAVLMELRRRGRQARHIYFVDDLDAFRKVPVDVPADYDQYLGMPLCDIPAPDGSDQSYADFFLGQLQRATKALGVDVTFIRSHEKYRSGYFVDAIERALEKVSVVRGVLEEVSGRKLDAHWTPIQVLESGRLKNRRFVSIDKNTKSITYEDHEGNSQTVRYDTGEVKLDWRLDWPARWWLQQVHCEASGRDHMTKGSSYDTGTEIVKSVFGGEAPYPVPYDFINMVGDTKKMSASKGTGLDAEESSTIMPPEVVRYFVLRAAPSKRLYFDPVNGIVQLMDEFAALMAKPDKTESEKQLLYICTHGQDRKTVSQVPFSHLVASYQASLKDVDRTLELLKKTEHIQAIGDERDTIRNELIFIDRWLQKRAPEDVKFALLETVNPGTFTDSQRSFLRLLSDRIAEAPADADGLWFHAAIYDFKEKSDLTPKELFSTLYQALIGKQSGPRAGWFLSILPRDWLIKRLRLEA